jgi:hypothetical protein
MIQSYIKDNHVKFSDLEFMTMNNIVSKDGGNILPEEIEFVSRKYNSIFGNLDSYLNKPLYKKISDVMIKSAHAKGIHIVEENPFRTKLFALEYAMNSPDKISESEFQKKIRCCDGSNYVMAGIYKAA